MEELHDPEEWAQLEMFSGQEADDLWFNRACLIWKCAFPGVTLPTQEDRFERGLPFTSFWDLEWDGPIDRITLADLCILLVQEDATILRMLQSQAKG